MKRGSFFWSCVQIIVGVNVNEIQTATCALVLLSREESVKDARFVFQHTPTLLSIYLFIMYGWTNTYILTRVDSNTSRKTYVH